MSNKAVQLGAEPENQFIGAGAVYLNYNEGNEIYLGETKGGSVFTVEREIRETEGDSEYGPMMGHRRKSRVMAKLVINAMELSKDNIANFIPASTATDQTSYWEIIESLTIADSDYFTNVAIVFENYKEEDMVIILYNALPDENFEIALEREDDVIPEITFTAHYDRATPRVVPYEIRRPQEDITPPTAILVPADEAAAVAVDTVTTVTFNEAMDISTLTKANLVLMETDGSVVVYTISIDATKKIATLTHDDYSASTDHILMATIGCKDLAGNALAANEVANFTTA